MWYSPYAVFLEFGVFSYILGNVRDNLEVFLEIVIGDTYLFRFSLIVILVLVSVILVLGPLASLTFSSSIRT